MGSKLVRFEPGFSNWNDTSLEVSADKRSQVLQNFYS